MTIGAVGYSANFESPQQPKPLILNLRSTPQRGFIEIFEQLRENEREKKILFASKSGAHIEYIHEKNREQKISRYCPFKSVITSYDRLSWSINYSCFRSQLGLPQLLYDRGVITTLILAGKAPPLSRSADLHDSLHLSTLLSIVAGQTHPYTLVLNEFSNKLSSINF